MDYHGLQKVEEIQSQEFFRATCVEILVQCPRFKIGQASTVQFVNDRLYEQQVDSFALCTPNRQKQDDLISTSATLNATSRSCLIIRASEYLPISISFICECPFANAFQIRSPRGMENGSDRVAEVIPRSGSLSKHRVAGHPTRTLLHILASGRMRNGKIITIKIQ